MVPVGHDPTTLDYESYISAFYPFLLLSINTTFQAKIESLLNNGQIGSYEYYKKTLKSIEDFTGTKIQFGSVNVDYLR